MLSYIIYGNALGSGTWGGQYPGYQWIVELQLLQAVPATVRV
jgi:hypothetical protein